METAFVTLVVFVAGLVGFAFGWCAGVEWLCRTMRKE
jgi:hypothetical protein